MSRRVASVALALALVAGALIAWSVTRSVHPSRAPIPRNVILITIDTLRADRLGCYGSDLGLTPHLDALADDAVRFANAYTVVPLTTPSHSSMLTGRYPITHGLRNNGGEALSSNELLLSEILREHGFRTAGIVSALVLTTGFGVNQGFDLFYEEGIKGSERGHGLWFDQRPADKSVDRAIAWLRAESDRPFFLWLHLFDPHGPYAPPSPWKERYEKTPYNGEVAFTDAQLGRLFDEVRDLGLWDESLIVVAADHGESLGEHQEEYHAVFLYNSTMHVPLIVRVPGGRRGLVIDDLASTLDITPTVLDALRIEGSTPLPRMDGVSLLAAAASGGRVPARSLFLETIYPSASYGWAAVRALVHLPWKLISLPTPELYDVAADPREVSNVHGREPSRVAELRSEYDTMFGELETNARPTETAEIDDETRDRLLSLGYIAGQQSRTQAHGGADPKKMAFMITPIKIAGDLLNGGKFADSEEVYRKVLEFDPDNRLALVNIGQALAGQGKLDEAVTFFERALKTYPDVEEYYRTYGRVLMRNRRLEDAEAVYRRALEVLPDSAHMHFLLGYVRFLGGRWGPAQDELEVSIGLNKKFGKPHYLIAICRLQKGDEAGALASLEEYLKRDPDVESLFLDPYFVTMRQRPAFQDLIKRFL